MLSKLFAPHRLVSGVIKSGAVKVCNQSIKPNLLIAKRWSGHNAMEIIPTKVDQKLVNNWIHFYMILTAVPVLLITTYINIRANPELCEMPEDYEPRHWEYHRHPITRFIAKHMTSPDEYDREMFMALHQDISENEILRRITSNVDKVMSFYNDHRTQYFIPFYGEYVRMGRHESEYQVLHQGTELGEYLDKAYDPEVNILPTEGYLAGPPGQN